MLNIKKIVFTLACCLSANSFGLTDQPFKAAAVEFNPKFMQFQNNLAPLAAKAEEAAKQGAKLIVLPELSNSGYLYNSRKQIEPYLDHIPGKTTAALEPIAHKYHTYIAVGISEEDPITHLAYNSAALIGPDGYIGKYRKNQLNSSDTRWATRGNLGYPVFNTELGKIALVICYDDIYLQSLLVPSLRGANIVAYITASDRLPPGQPGVKNNHSTIANIATLPGWVGVYLVATTRTDNETNPETGITTHYDGGASIWDPLGKNLAQAPVSPEKNPSAPVTIYANIDPKLYNNSVKAILQTRRRPELYHVLSLYRAPTDPAASTQAHAVNAALVQFTPVKNDKKANLATIKKLLANKNSNLIILPENALIGDGLSPAELKQDAEDQDGLSIQQMSELAEQYHANLIFSMPEKLGKQFYETAFLFNEKGYIIGFYRKSHLNAEEKLWAQAGNKIPVFKTSIGRIGIMLGDEVQIPDMASVMAVKRADIIAIPTAWHGEYGGKVEVAPDLLVKPFPENTMFIWYDIAKYAQAYTLVANYTGGAQKDLGSSGVYSLAPVEGLYPPQLASPINQEAYLASFETLGSSDWWINQNDYIIGRRAELITPALMPMNSSCFKEWQKNSTNNEFCWDK